VHRIRRFRYRVFARLGSLAGRATGARRLVLLALAAVAALLGAWGWRIYEDQHPGLDLDLLALVHAVAGLFVLEGEPQTVSWQLSVARILAPVALAGAATELVLVAFEERLRIRAAAQGVDHLVVVGPSPRARPYLRTGSDHVDLLAPAVHVERSASAPVEGTIRIDDDGTEDRWIGASNATRAGRVVLATGRDDRNLAAMAALLERAPGRDGDLLVEVNDRDLGLRLSVMLASEHPDAHVDVVSRDVALASFAAGLLDPALDDRFGREGRARPCFTVIGDSRLSRLFAPQAAEALKRFAATSSRFVAQLTMVHPGDDEDWAELAEATAEEGRLETRFSGDPEDFLCRVHEPVAALVDFRDPELTAATAVRLLGASPGSTVWIIREGNLLPRRPASSTTAGAAPEPDRPHPARIDLRVLSLEQAERAGHLVGPFTRAARWWHARHGSTDPQQCRRTAEQLRRVVGALVRDGWAICPDQDLQSMDRMRAAVHLEPPMRDALTSAGLVDLDVDQHDLILCLGEGGLVVPVPDL
jgi:hypothetical protein